DPAVEQIRAHVAKRLGALSGRQTEDGSLSHEDAKLFVAKFCGFESWAELESSVTQASSARQPAHGVSATPPFYRLLWKSNPLGPLPPRPWDGWDQIFEVMLDKRLTGLRSSWLMTDDVLERLAQLDHVTSLDLSGSERVTDEGLRHLAKMPQLEILKLSGCD